tara:strand:+ start:7180 stop:7347 length:168 start_codon:yes stop_codon:yes gene_type:complete
MEIKLKKSWRYAGQIYNEGAVLKITNNDTLKFLKENGYLYKEEKKEKKSKVKIAE